MNDQKALDIIEKIFQSIFNTSNHYKILEIKDKFAFDVKIPKEVKDSLTGETTWADATNNDLFITNENMAKKDNQEGWMLEKKEITSIDDIIAIWNTINYTTTERVYDSINVIGSDTIYRCENIYHSTGCSDSKNLIFCDSCGHSEFLIASQRSGSCNFCIRTDDSQNCSNSYNVICSNKISNSFFIQDCFNLHECMFCSHIASKRFCIANMQFEEDEYYQIKEIIIKWITTS